MIQHLQTNQYSPPAPASTKHKLNQQQFPRIQIRTVRKLMEGKSIERPSSVAAVDETFKESAKGSVQGRRTEIIGIVGFQR